MSITPRRTVLLLALVAATALCIGAPVGWAAGPTVKVYQNDASFSNGGEFSVQIVTGSLYHIDSMDPAHKTATEPGYAGFRTFCAQKSEVYVPGVEYSVVVDTKTNHGIGKPLSPQAAYLFHLWNSGKLAGYTYTIGEARRADAGQLQQAIWAWMTEVAPPVSGKAYTWWKMALDDVGGPKWSGLGGVKVLQLHGKTDTGMDHFQDQLMETPEPASLALLAIGALPALPMVRRRRAL